LTSAARGARPARTAAAPESGTAFLGASWRRFVDDIKAPRAGLDVLKGGKCAFQLRGHFVRPGEPLFQFEELEFGPEEQRLAAGTATMPSLKPTRIFVSKGIEAFDCRRFVSVPSKGLSSAESYRSIREVTLSWKA
jgi:hypothetical protein